MASRDDRLVARVRWRRPLRYSCGADVAHDRPAHVRAGSGLAWIDGWLAVVQDDSNFVALVDPSGDRVEFVSLPAFEQVRQFDEHRGNKALKLDLEACVSGRDASGAWLLAFGSGSTTARRRLVRITGLPDQPEVRLVDASALYDRLANAAEFAGSELNIEGAVRVGDRLRLFQRGNGASRGDRVPVDATADFGWEPLSRWLAGTGPLPEPTDIVRYELGELDGVRLTFTDATECAGRVIFVAAAEDSPDTYRDGVVRGSAIGVLDGDRARWAPIRDEHGGRAADKAEGVVVDPSDERVAYVVVDKDDHRVPAELWSVELEGPWGNTRRSEVPDSA